MAYVPHMSHAHEGAPAALPVGGLWTALAARLDRYRNYRRTLDELTVLSDRELADIGIHRGMIHDIAREAADRA